MKFKPSRGQVQMIATSLVVVVVGYAMINSGQSSEQKQAAQFQKRNDDFDRFSAVRGEGNVTKPRPIADEAAQAALLGDTKSSDAGPAAAVKPVAVEASPSKSSPKADCSTAWNADESCSKDAAAAMEEASKPAPAAQEPKAAAKVSERIESEPAATERPARREPERPKAARLVSTSEPAPEKRRPVAAVPSQAPGRMDLSAYEQQLIAMSSAKGDAVTGRDVKSNMDILKKGSRYLGIINEAMIVRTGEKHDVTIDVIARLSNNTTVKPFLLYGEAKLNKSGTRVEITVTDCIAADAAAESIPCKGVIQDHRGVTGLDGDSYNPAHYANALKLVSAVVGGGFVAMKTTSRTLNGGILYDQTFGNGVLDALAGSVVEAGKDEADEIKSEGKRVEIAPGAFVQVLISEDVALW